MKNSIFSSILKSNYLKITGFMFIFCALLCVMPTMTAEAAESVTVYEHSGYRSDGNRQDLIISNYFDIKYQKYIPAQYFYIVGEAKFGVGSYNLFQDKYTAYQANGEITKTCEYLGEDSLFLNDKMSSLKIPSGYMVVLYEHDNFSGNSITLTKDTPDLSKVSPNLNDKVSSMKVFYNPNPSTLLDVSSFTSIGTGWEWTDGFYNVYGNDVIITGTADEGRIVIGGGTPDAPRRVTLSDLGLISSEGPAITIAPGSNVILTLDGNNYLRGEGLYAGISTTGAKLTINAGAGEARLTAQGYDRGAGIGGNGGKKGDDSHDIFHSGGGGVGGNDGGTIIINGGNVSASSVNGAGIGGGAGGNGGRGRGMLAGGNGGNAGNGASLTINGGSLIASSGNSSAIGGGKRGDGGPANGAGSKGERGKPGSLGSINFGSSEYSFQTSRNDTVYKYPPNSFTLNDSYGYVRIDCPAPVPSKPTIGLNKNVYLPNDTITINWEKCNYAFRYEVYIKDETDSEVMVLNSSNTNANTTSFSIDAKNYAPGNYTVWVNSLNQDLNGIKRGESNRITFNIAENINNNITARVQITKNSPKKYYAFTPTINGTYIFESDNKEAKYQLIGSGNPLNIVWNPNTYPVGDLFDANMNPVTASHSDFTTLESTFSSSQSGTYLYQGGREFIKKYYLTANQTYIFEARNQDTLNEDRDHSTERGAFDLKVYRSDTPSTAESLSNVYNPKVFIDGAGQKNYLEFTAKQTGVHTFESSEYGDAEPTLAVYNSDEEQMGDGGNSIQIFLAGGETYYIEAGLANGEAGSYILSVGDVTKLWDSGVSYEPGTIFAYGTDSNGKPVFYIVLQAHTSMAHWLPGSTPSLYKMITAPLWSQPIGPYDAYSMGAEVMYNGQLWVSTIDTNVWRPGVHGWVLA